jgi:hypothetical protein
MMKKLLLTTLLAPLAVGCGSDDDGDDGNTSSTVYLLDVPANRWTEPRGFASDVGAFVQQFVIRDDGSSATVGLAHEGAQDTCSKTVTLPKNGDTIGPANYEIYLPASEAATGSYAGVAVVAAIENFTLTNVLPSGGTTSEVGSLSADADARDLWPLFYQIFATSGESVCNTIDTNSSGEVTCRACGDGEPMCLTMEAEGLGATAFSGEFQEVAESCPEMLPPED